MQSSDYMTKNEIELIKRRTRSTHPETSHHKPTHHFVGEVSAKTNDQEPWPRAELCGAQPRGRSDDVQLDKVAFWGLRQIQMFYYSLITDQSYMNKMLKLWVCEHILIIDHFISMFKFQNLQMYVTFM